MQIIYQLAEQLIAKLSTGLWHLTAPVGTGDVPVADWQKREKAASSPVRTGRDRRRPLRRLGKNAIKLHQNRSGPATSSSPIRQKRDKGASSPVRTSRDRRPPGRRLGKSAIKTHQDQSGPATSSSPIRQKCDKVASKPVGDKAKTHINYRRRGRRRSQYPLRIIYKCIEKAW